VTLDEVTGELVPAEPITMTAAQAASYMDAYEKACRAMLKAEDFQRINKREFIKRSGWRKLGVWAMVSAEIIEEREFRNDSGQLVRARFKVRATSPNGRHMDGIGICDVTERQFTHPEHDIVATAHTRAINRAFADLFGLGAVSAEEMTEERPSFDARRLEVEREARAKQPKTMAVSVDPGAEDITAREDDLSAEELDGYLGEIERRNLRGTSRSVLRAKAKMLDAIEAGRAEQASEPHDPADPGSDYDRYIEHGGGLGT
jgi:hypothetical protein